MQILLKNIFFTFTSNEIKQLREFELCWKSITIGFFNIFITNESLKTKAIRLFSWIHFFFNFKYNSSLTLFSGGTLCLRASWSWTLSLMSFVFDRWFINHTGFTCGEIRHSWLVIRKAVGGPTAEIWPKQCWYRRKYKKKKQKKKTKKKTNKNKMYKLSLNLMLILVSRYDG